MLEYAKKKINTIIIVLVLSLLSFQVMAQESKALCEESYYLGTATNALNASIEKMDGYSVSSPSVSIGPGGYRTICVTVSKAFGK